MSCSLQTQVCSILEVLLKAAAAQIGQLLQEDAAAVQMEIRRRNEEIRSLKSRLWSCESRLEKLTAARCSVGVQVHITDTGVTAHDQETLMLTSPMMNVFSEEKPLIPRAPELQLQPLKREDPASRAAPHAEEEEEEEEELSGLELQMKIEQVEEFVDRKLSIHDGNSQIWSSQKELGHHQSLAEPESHAQSFPDAHVMMMEDSGASSALVQENDRNNDCDFNLLQSHEHSSVSDAFSLSASHPPKTHTQSLQQGDDPRLQAGFKPFRCEECGKSFTQRTRLITHGRVHTGEKPFRCRLCGKMFSRQDNCLRHMRLHGGQSWPAGT
ncbi:uncharacterized protein si:dkeyp-68b7.7 isoform X4 [Danio rerio]|uniref:Uncharacterized protein si:dkeyp-68b7.7 isoform X4 n=1 Tax=Danio rerio TaxID=7955 RepID=A0AC58I1V6_DANRE